MKNYFVALLATAVQVVIVIGAIWLIDGEKPHALSIAIALGMTALFAANQAHLREA